MLKRPLHCFLALAVAAAALPSAAQNSQISLDGSLPHGRTDVLTGPGTGPEYVISEDLGWRSGSNLFHSFLRFSVGLGETATFTGPSEIENILARVTGGDPSQINGIGLPTIKTALTLSFRNAISIRITSQARKKTGTGERSIFGHFGDKS